MPSQLLQQKVSYSELIVRAGLNLQPGQRLLISESAISGVDIHLAPFVRLIVAAAYRAGAHLVDVIWDDPRLLPIRFREAAAETAKEHSAWRVSAGLEFLERGARSSRSGPVILICSVALTRSWFRSMQMRWRSQPALSLPRSMSTPVEN